MYMIFGEPMNDILQSLNEKQKEAVTAIDGAYLVLAGPGSGKTRVITHRFAYILHARPVHPENILAVTFTNKAANEMKERIAHLTNIRTEGLWIRTFHSMGYRILREYASLLGYEKRWEAIDDADAARIVRKIVKTLPGASVYGKTYKPEQLVAAIARVKEEEVSLEEAIGKRVLLPAEREFLEGVYQQYQQSLQRAQLMDYSDLLVNTHVLLRDYPHVLEHYQELWRYIMVDEFQDTNRLQYEIVALLARKYANIMIVGDDDQSIYSWRGARVDNMRLFERAFQAHIIKLEQNYRSTDTIIKAANSIAQYIDDRMGKTLWTENHKGDPIVVMYGQDERSLYDRVIQKIKKLTTEGYALKDMAIFYRINAQSQAIEDLLIRHEIPYHIVGSLRFFERREIKDVLSYVAFLVNPRNEVAFERMIDVPSRGIGEASVEKLVAYAREHACDLLAAMQRASEIPGMGARGRVLQELAEGLGQLRDHMDDLMPSTLLRILVEMVPFEQYWRDQDDLERWENIQALVDAATLFEETSPGARIEDFLNYTILNSTEERVRESDYITLMTIHNAKGLEFRVVFVIGVVDGLLPLGRSVNSSRGENEERRLFYVAVTRAKEKLFLCVPEMRFAFGETVPAKPSPFLEYIPAECLSEEGERDVWGGFRRRGTETGSFERRGREPARAVSWEVSSQPSLPGKVPASPGELQPGMRVRHRLLGEGIVEKTIGQRVVIRFESGAVQTLDGNFLSSVEIL